MDELVLKLSPDMANLFELFRGEKKLGILRERYVAGVARWESTTLSGDLGYHNGLWSAVDALLKLEGEE